ncbi:hypothetical protein GCM10023185_20080 [Hymenobacter saemangeumensis]|uniref:Uncharacterized protein n=1 Tax=Hymenobacter saemangeumensis TaxID=1084522 RepID=A0ABP8IDL6_9BACT
MPARAAYRPSALLKEPDTAGVCATRLGRLQVLGSPTRKGKLRHGLRPRPARLGRCCGRLRYRSRNRAGSVVLGKYFFIASTQCGKFFPGIHLPNAFAKASQEKTQE